MYEYKYCARAAPATTSGTVSLIASYKHVGVNRSEHQTSSYSTTRPVVVGTGGRPVPLLHRVLSSGYASASVKSLLVLLALADAVSR